MNGTRTAEEDLAAEPDGFETDLDGLVKNGLEHISEEESVEDIFAVPYKANTQCKTKNGPTIPAISPKVEKNDDYLEGSFKHTASRVNGVRGLKHTIDTPLEEVEDNQKGARPRYTTLQF